MPETIKEEPSHLVEMTSEDFSEQIVEVTDPLLALQVSTKFDSILKNVVRRLLGEGEAADKALASGSFVFDGLTVVLRLNEDNDSIELYADMGLPDTSADHAGIYGALLQMNLHNTHEGIVFGKNETSKRLVACLKGHVFMMDDDGDFCLACLQHLTAAVHQVRTW